MAEDLDMSAAVQRAEEARGTALPTSKSADESWSGVQLPLHVESKLHDIIDFIEVAQEYTRRSLYLFTQSDFLYISKFANGQIALKFAGVIGELEEVRMLLAPAKEGRP